MYLINHFAIRPTCPNFFPCYTSQRICLSLCLSRVVIDEFGKTHTLLFVYIFSVACAGVGGGAGGIPFEVWCRYYYPNIRDQVAAKVSDNKVTVKFKKGSSVAHW